MADKTNDKKTVVAYRGDEYSAVYAGDRLVFAGDHEQALLAAAEAAGVEIRLSEDFLGGQRWPDAALKALGTVEDRTAVRARKTKRIKELREQAEALLLEADELGREAAPAPVLAVAS